MIEPERLSDRKRATAPVCALVLGLALSACGRGKRLEVADTLTASPPSVAGVDGRLAKTLDSSIE